MPNPAYSYDTRVLFLHAPEGPLLRALEALTYQSKNLRNTANFLLRQVLTAYEWEKSLGRLVRKDTLHETQVEALAHFNSAIAEVNSKRTAKHPLKIEKALASHLAKGNPEADFALYRLIRYKAQARGIAVVETEESYTSQTSFVNNEELLDYADKERRIALDTPPPVRTGKRLSDDRNWFRHKNRTDRWGWVHADVNGALNIVRKVFRSFAFSIRVTLKFDLLRLSTRLGVVPIQLA